MTKLTNEQKVELLAKNICKMVGIEAIDLADGNSNWWMFNNDAEKIITDLESRGFKIWDWIELKKNTE